jgi:hypothetical protein
MWRLCLAGLATIFVAACTVAVLGLTTKPAQAAPAKLPTDTSYYMSSKGYNTAYSLGCAQANADNQTGQDSFVVLDYGVQRQSNDGTIDTVNQAYWSYNDIEDSAKGFVWGYWICVNTPGTQLHFGLGTNNSNAANVTTAAGQTWGDVVNVVSNYISYVGQVVVNGANDIESWVEDWQPKGVPYSSTLDWANGYNSHTSALYLNFGSYDGCPVSTYSDGGCNAGWDQYDYWYLSWGFPPALTAPEIYYFSGAQKAHMISAYGAAYQNSQVAYTAPWDQYAACTCTYTAQEAWDNLWNQMNTVSPVTAEDFPYSMEIRYQ